MLTLNERLERGGQGKSDRRAGRETSDSRQQSGSQFNSSVCVLPSNLVVAVVIDRRVRGGGLIEEERLIIHWRTGRE